MGGPLESDKINSAKIALFDSGVTKIGYKHYIRNLKALR